MSDPFSTGLDEDPAADFLAREQQELAGLEDDGFGGLASDTTAAVEVNQFESLQQRITDLQSLLSNPAVSAGDGLDFFGGEIISSTDTAPVQDYFGETDFGSGSLDPLSEAPPESKDINGGAAVLLDPLADDEPVTTPSTGIEGDIIGSHAAPSVEENSSLSAGDELDIFGGEVVPSTNSVPAQEYFGDADFGIGPLDPVSGTPPESNDIDGKADVLSDSSAYDDLVRTTLTGIEGDILCYHTAPDTEVNGDDSPPHSEVAPTQKTLIWREEQLKKIAEKDKNEEAKLEEWRNTAKRELEEWYARQAEQVEKHKKNNRVAEAEFVKERDETTPGNEWERISRLCDFNPKNNKNTKDVSKLRSLLLQLKQNPLARSSTA